MPERTVHVTVRVEAALVRRLEAVLAKANAAQAARMPGGRELTLSDVIRRMLWQGVEMAEQGGGEDG